MKKTDKSLILFFATVSILFYSCQNEPYDGDLDETVTNNECQLAVNRSASSEVAFSGDNLNTDLCIEYKAALQNQINLCGDASGEIQAKIIDLGDCI